jgi:hypothetical protein
MPYLATDIKPSLVLGSRYGSNNGVSNRYKIPVVVDSTRGLNNIYNKLCASYVVAGICSRVVRCFVFVEVVPSSILGIANILLRHRKNTVDIRHHWHESRQRQAACFPGGRFPAS